MTQVTWNICRGLWEGKRKKKEADWEGIIHGSTWSLQSYTMYSDLQSQEYLIPPGFCCFFFFFTEWTLIFASKVSHCRTEKNDEQCEQERIGWLLTVRLVYVEGGSTITVLILWWKGSEMLYKHLQTWQVGTYASIVRGKKLFKTNTIKSLSIHNCSSEWMQKYHQSNLPQKFQ